MRAHQTIIAPETVMSHLDDPAWVIVDCRYELSDPEAGRRAFLEAHIPGAVYAHLDADLAGPVTASSGRHPLPDPTALAATLGHWGIDTDTQVIGYDDAGGAIAARLWWLLRWLGHEAVAVLDGGLAAWRAAGGPLNAAPPAPRAKHFTPRPRAERWVSTKEMARHLRSPQHLVLDVRARERFLGRHEPLDTVAGHIPGALNRPFADNLDERGRFKSAETLRREHLKLLGANRSSDLICMCGSGVTACHELLALEIAGLPGSRLYVGSWSEWIRDPARPVALENDS